MNDICYYTQKQDRKGITMLDKDQRNVIVENFQSLLRPIRNIMDCSIAEMAEAIGVTRQTMNNLENRKTGMSQTQYIALSAFIDHYFRQNDQLLPAIQAIIDQGGRSRSLTYDTSFQEGSLLLRWFNGVHLNASVSEADGEIMALQDVLRRYKVFLDTDVLLTENASVLVDVLADISMETGTKIIVLLRAVEKLRAHHESAIHWEALKYLKRLQMQNLLDIRGEESDPNVCDTFLSVFVRFRSMHRLCLITQNRALAQEVLRLNETAFDKRGVAIVAGFVQEDRLHTYVAETAEEDETFVNLNASHILGWDSIDVDLDEDAADENAMSYTQHWYDVDECEAVNNPEEKNAYRQIPNGWAEV